MDVQLFLNSILSATFNFSLDLEFLSCAPFCSSNLHLLLVGSFQVAQTITLSNTQTITRMSGSSLPQRFECLLLTLCGLQLAVDTCLTLGNLDFQNLLLVQNQIRLAVLTLSLCTAADLHVANALKKVLRLAQSQHRAQLWQVSDCTTL
jgi:hypothetical protein